MDCPTVQHRSAHDRSAAERKEELTDDALGDCADLGDQEEPVTVTSVDGGVHRTAETGGALRQGLEHGLDVGRRAADDTEYFRGRRLLIQGLSQLTVPGLELPERLRQALLQVADPGVVVPGRLAGDSGLGLDLVLRGFGTPTHRPLVHASFPISASACSSQNRMSISRYIVVAVMRCWCASSRLPVRR